MRQSFRFLVALSVVWSIFLVAAPSSHAICGNGIIEGGEECDGGPILYVDGDPAKGECTTGSRCYYQFTCCKFNCQYVGTPGVPCQDGDSCSGPDVCDQVGVCQGGPAVADSTPCDDGLFCNGSETCNNGVCSSHTGDPCPGTACNECQESTDSCFNPPTTTPCSGSTCVTGGTCDGAGTCNGGTFNAGPCDDGVYCNGTDTCNGGTCSVHTGDPCPDSNDGDSDCLESCDEAADSCTGPDTESVPCDDGLYCNGGSDVCTSGACTGTGSVACDDGNDCTLETCDEGLDMCTANGLSLDGTACDDGDQCTFVDVCMGGVCTGPDAVLDDFCPWVLMLRDPIKKDLIKIGRSVQITGDVCGGAFKSYGKSNITSDLVSNRLSGTPLRLAPDMTIGEDIVTAGGGAKAIPGSGILPYTATSILSPGTVQEKNDLTGFYDFSGSHLLLAKCDASRSAFTDGANYLDGLTATSVDPVATVPNEGAATITATVPGGLNVVDFNGSLKVGKDATLTLDGAGDPDTVMVLRIAGKLDMKLRSTLVLENGLTTAHLMIYVKGKQCKLGDTVLGGGTLLCSPGRVKARRVFAWIGAIFGDARKMLIGDQCDLIYDPFTGF